MRQTLDQLSIPYTDDERVLTDVDMLIGDKKSDEKRAGRYGVKFIDVTEFSMDKVLAKSINQSVTIPGMNRTAIGDIWNGNINDYRENGAPVIANSMSQKDILVRLLGAYGFVTNDIAEGLPSTRFEQKLGFSVATVQGGKDGQLLEVTITDKTGRPELVTDRWDQLYAYLVSKYPKSE